MPALTEEEAILLAGMRRLLARLGAGLPLPRVDSEPTLSLILKEFKHMSETFDTEMTKLRLDVAAQSSVIASATAAFRGLAARLVAAEASAKNAGATDAQVAGVTALREQLEANTNSLAAAIPANTDQSTTPTTPVTTAPGDATTTTAAGTAPATTPATDAASSVAATTPAPTAADAATLAANQAR